MTKKLICLILTLTLIFGMVVFANAQGGEQGEAGAAEAPTESSTSAQATGSEAAPENPEQQSETSSVVGGSSDTVTEVPVNITAPASNFSVTLPTSVNLAIGTNGASNEFDVVIENKSAGPIIVKSAIISGVNGWKIVADSNFAAVPAGTKSVCFYMDGAPLAVSGGIGTAPAGLFGAINGGAREIHRIKAYIPAQATAINASVATVRFTIGWYGVGAN